MSTCRRASLLLATRLVCATLCLSVVAAAPGAHAQAVVAPAAAAASAPADTLRPAVATPLQAVAGLLAEKKGKEALDKVAEAEAVGNLTPYETMILQRQRAAAAQVAGDQPLVLKSVEAALATGLVPVAEQLGLVEALVSVAVNTRDHERVLRWSQRYIELNGPNDSVRLVRIQTQAITGDDRSAITALLERQAAADKGGSLIPEAQMRLLLNLQLRNKDAGASKTLERLATNYPRPEYWQDLVTGAARGVGDNDRALAEMYRLLRSAGALTNADLRHGLADTALRVGQPAEALVVLDEGYAAGVLGTGPEAAQHQKLRDVARKQAATDVADRPAAEAAARRAPDGNGLVQLGWTLVTALPTGSTGAAAEPGLAFIEQGIAKGGLRRATEAQLHLGIAQYLAGRKDAARLTLAALAKADSAKEGLTEPIRLWSLWAAAPALLPKAN